MLEYRIPLQADYALDSVDDHLKFEGESRHYEVRLITKTKKMMTVVALFVDGSTK